MYRKIIINDIKKNKLITLIIIALIFIAALLTSLASIISVNLFFSIKNMMNLARTPDYLQMHSGDINRDRLINFANSNNYVEDFQILELLNIENSNIIIKDSSLIDSIQNNGFTIQSEKFDFLLDSNGNIIYPKEGEIYIPIIYMKERSVNKGDIVKVNGFDFIVKDFLRDSQMNSPIASSKRFLINENDFNKLSDFGKLEYLIEFQLDDGVNYSDFETEYQKNNLEANGPPAITYPLFKLVNGISDGIMVALFIIIIIIVIGISFLCIRFTLISQIEEDYKEIGTLKAIGMRISKIKRIYLSKYFYISIIGCLLGFLTSLFLQYPLMENMRAYMGGGGVNFLGILLGFIGAFIIFLINILYISIILNKLKRVSVVESLKFGMDDDKVKTNSRFQLNKTGILSTNSFLGMNNLLGRKRLYGIIIVIIIFALSLMIIPWNIYNTMASKGFIKYMGIGISDIRIDIQQSENIFKNANILREELENDKDVSKYTVLKSYMLEMVEDNNIKKIKIEFGDHSLFAIDYIKGRIPEKENEIALSRMLSEDLEKSVGDSINLLLDGKEKEIIVSGIYSDITNGGKTSKANFKINSEDALWFVIPVSFRDPEIIEEKITYYRDKFDFAKFSHINEYIGKMLGSTIETTKKASYISIFVGIFLVLLIIVLFSKMLIVKDRYFISILKSLGFTNNSIRKQYRIGFLIILLIGLLFGGIFGNKAGEVIGLALFATFGVSEFYFADGRSFTFMIVPIILFISSNIGLRIGLKDIKRIKISNYIKG